MANNNMIVAPTLCILQIWLPVLSSFLRLKLKLKGKRFNDILEIQQK